MIIQQTNHFKKNVKRLQPNQKKQLDDAIKKIIQDPSLGIEKKGSLKGMFVYKFKMNKQLTLVAYKKPNTNIIILISVGSHENFYKEIENKVI